MSHSVISFVFQPAKERRGRDFYPPIITVEHPTAIVPSGALAQVVCLFPADDASQSVLYRDFRGRVHHFGGDNQRCYSSFISLTSTSSNSQSDVPAERVPRELVLFTVRLNV